MVHQWHVSSALSEGRDIPGIPSESRNVLLNPEEGESLIVEPEIERRSWIRVSWFLSFGNQVAAGEEALLVYEVEKSFI